MLWQGTRLLNISKANDYRPRITNYSLLKYTVKQQVFCLCGEVFASGPRLVRTQTYLHMDLHTKDPPNVFFLSLFPFLIQF